MESTRYTVSEAAIMTPEFYAIIIVGITLGGSQFAFQRSMHRDIGDLRERMARLEGEVRGFMAGFKAQSI